MQKLETEIDKTNNNSAKEQLKTTLNSILKTQLQIKKSIKNNEIISKRI